MPVGTSLLRSSDFVLVGKMYCERPTRNNLAIPSLFPTVGTGEYIYQIDGDTLKIGFRTDAEGRHGKRTSNA
jgi:hypothetical protein